MFNTDSFGNIFFPAGVSVGNYPTITTTPTHVLVAGAGGRISRVAISQLTSSSPVTSVFGRTGAVVAIPGDYDTDTIKENTNLYFTVSRARASISLTALGTTGPATYDPVTGVINVPQYQNEFSGVNTFNTRVGDVVLTALDVTTALTYTPIGVETDPVWGAQKVLYYTKVESDALFALVGHTHTTTEIAEGTNLYFTTARARAAFIAGNNITITNGVISSADSYVLPTATSTILGGVKIGAGITITLGVISVSTNYEPPITAGTTLQYFRGDKTFQTLPIYTLAGLGGQPQLNGTGFVKASGTTISYDNSTYYLASNPSGYITSASIGNGTLTLNVSGNGLSGSTSFTANQSSGSTFTVTSNATTSATANTLVYRDSAADIYTRYFFGSYINTSDNDEAGITRFIIKNGDNYHRSATTTVAANIIRGVASGTWSINITGNAETVDGFSASQSTVGNNIVVRDPNGYIFGNYINMSDDGNPGGGTSISSFITKQGDNYYRSVSPTNAMVSIRGVASGTWGIGITGNAGSITNQANSATITASTGVNANHIVQRDGNGYIYANHINFNTSESENPTINSFFTSNGDGWSRKSSLQHVRNQLGNYGGWITGYTETDTLASVTSRGSVTSTTITASNFITSSDRRVKSEITNIENPFEILDKINSYEYIKDGNKEAGFIAQEVQEAIPYAVFEGDNGMLTMSDRPVLAYLFAAVMELKKENTILKEKLGL